MAKNDEQENNMFSVTFQEEEDEPEEEAEELLTPEEVLAAFRIIANTIDETCESGPDWAPWYFWTVKQARQLLDYVDCIAWHNENIRTTLALIGIKFEDE